MAPKKAPKEAPKKTPRVEVCFISNHTIGWEPSQKPAQLPVRPDPPNIAESSHAPTASRANEGFEGPPSKRQRLSSATSAIATTRGLSQSGDEDPVSQSGDVDPVSQPGDEEWSLLSSLPPAVADKEVMEEFCDYLRAKIRRLERTSEDSTGSYVPTDRDTRTTRATEKKQYLLMLTIALAPRSANIEGLTLAEFKIFRDRRRGRNISFDYDFDHLWYTFVGGVGRLEQIWYSRRGKDTGDRTSKDKAAQKRVPEWYGGCCVLTGGRLAQGAHIIPARVVQDQHPQFNLIHMLECFWPSSAIEALKSKRYEQENILPLRPDPHYLWDRHHFAIRPIKHPVEPQNTDVYPDGMASRFRQKDRRHHR